MQDSNPIPCPFRIYVDSAEQHFYEFEGMTGRRRKYDHRIVGVELEFLSLGRGDESLGDYSLEGCIGECHVERKSMSDCHNTILGFNSGRRERFERELRNLSDIPAGLVVVECSLKELIENAPDRGYREPQENARILYRSILSFEQTYPVKWIFAGDRRFAEKVTFDWLWRYWETRSFRKQLEKEGRDRWRPWQQAPAPAPVASSQGSPSNPASVAVNDAVASLF